MELDGPELRFGTTMPLGEAETAWHPELAAEILQSEIDHGPLGATTNYVAYCTEDERSLIIQIARRNGNIISAVRLPQ